MKKVLKWVGITFLGLLVLGFIVNVLESPKQKATEKAAKEEASPMETVTAGDIARAYHENTVAADQRFKSKKIKISGKVADINTDIMGNPYITLRGGVNQFMEPQFAFNKSSADSLANLKKGSKVTLICTGKGDIAKTPMLDSCSLL
ncbi:MAG: hypothetical protein ABFD25_20475 [Clostridiaceae bacterium]